MNPLEQNRWKSAVLEEALQAFASDTVLRDSLIFKGARILNLRLGNEIRQSLDIDSNLAFGFQQAHPRVEEQQQLLETRFATALRRFFDRQNPVRFSVENITVEPRPTRMDHPFGWNGFVVRVRIRDGRQSDLRGIPAVEIDVAASEALGPGAVSDLTIHGNLTIRAYTLERIAGEKLRAFLSSLPVYIEKIGRRSDAIRVKDLYDLARIRRARATDDLNFWRTAGMEFRLACKSRFIDCMGIETFMEGSTATEIAFRSDPTLPKDIEFEEVKNTLIEVVVLFKQLDIVPFQFPLPRTP